MEGFGSPCILCTILDLTVQTKTQGWLESFETKNQYSHCHAATSLHFLPFSLLVWSSPCNPLALNNRFASFTAIASSSVSVTPFLTFLVLDSLIFISGLWKMIPRTKSKSSLHQHMASPSILMNAHCSWPNPWISCYSQNLSAFVIHPRGFVPVKSSNSTFLAHMSSISCRAGALSRIRQIGIIFRNPRIEWNIKDNCIKKIGKRGEKTLIHRIPLFTLESLLYSQSLQWSDTLLTP